MNIFEVIDKVEGSDAFKKFKDKSPKSYFCAAFFIIDYEAKDAKKQIDYYISDEDVMTFTVEGESVKEMEAKLPKKEKIPEILKEKVKLDEEKAIEIGKKESEIGEFKKVIAVLQTLDGKPVWNLSCMKGLMMMRYHVSAEDGKVLKKEKINLMDMMKFDDHKKTPDYIQ